MPALITYDAEGSYSTWSQNTEHRLIDAHPTEYISLNVRVSLCVILRMLVGLGINN